MFEKDKERYISKGVKEKINAIIYLMIWEMIDEVDISIKYCLHVFDLKAQDGMQEIIYKQDELPISTVKFYTNFGTNAKVYVINTDESETMFLGEEF